MTSGATLRQFDLFETTEETAPWLPNTTSTFAGNLTLPIHRWFRYSAGFSATWARELIDRERANGRQTILDPFAGSGITVIEGEIATKMFLC